MGMCPFRSTAETVVSCIEKDCELFVIVNHPTSGFPVVYGYCGMRSPLSQNEVIQKFYTGV